MHCAQRHTMHKTYGAPRSAFCTFLPDALSRLSMKRLGEWYRAAKLAPPYDLKNDKLAPFLLGCAVA
jgi:hypothetical protein